MKKKITVKTNTIPQPKKQKKAPAVKAKYKAGTEFVVWTLTKDGARKAHPFKTEAEADKFAAKQKATDFAKIWLANEDDLHIRNYKTTARK